MIDQVSVTAIIPCYNCEKTIARAINSVLAQTFRPSELILVNDASKDGTLNIIKYYEKIYPSLISVIDLKHNVGAGSARNAGWRAASCIFIAFLDADDSWHQRKIEIQYKYMLNNPHVDVVGHLYSIYSNEIDYSNEKIKVRNISARSLIFKNYLSTPCVMLKRNVHFNFEENKRHSEDLFLWQNLALTGAVLVRLEIKLATIHKSIYADYGLNSDLLKMERGELHNLINLIQTKKISPHLFILGFIFSLAKFFRRFIVVSITRSKLYNSYV